MTVSERDIWIAANEVIKAHDDPLLHAAMQYDRLLKDGDTDGCRAWRRITQAIEALLQTDSGGVVH